MVVRAFPAEARCGSPLSTYGHLEKRGERKSSPRPQTCEFFEAHPVTKEVMCEMKVMNIELIENKIDEYRLQARRAATFSSYVLRIRAGPGFLLLSRALVGN